MDMTKPVRVGVIGLGRRWRKRYKPALLALRKLFRIQALYDSVQYQADQEAKLLDCEAAAGPTQMLESEEIDALLLLDAQWFGWWPVQAACRYRKPVFCAGSLVREGVHAEALVRQVRDSQLPVMLALAPRLAPATVRLRQLLSQRLGVPSVLLCDAACPVRNSSAQPGAGSGILALIDWCAAVMGRLPVTIQAMTTSAPAFASLLLDFGDGRTAQIIRRPAPVGCGALRLHASAERGTAVAVLPGRVHWASSNGKQTQSRLARGSLTAIMLQHFQAMVISGRAPESSLEDAYRIVGLLRAAY